MSGHSISTSPPYLVVTGDGYIFCAVWMSYSESVFRVMNMSSTLGAITTFLLLQGFPVDFHKLDNGLEIEENKPQETNRDK
jgi:hypothetical protein